jgi:hypothetical protein
MGGLRQSRLMDIAITPLMRINFRIARLSARFQIASLALLSPSTVSVAAPVLLGIPPRTPETLTPAEARERYGVLPPTEEYARFKEQVAARLAVKSGASRADERAIREDAFTESEPVLGPVA